VEKGFDMMAAEDSNDYTPSTLDIIKLEDLEIGEGFFCESGVWSVFRYKDEYLLFTEKGKQMDFKDLASLIKFLGS
jgi:hypothetical protein